MQTTPISEPVWQSLQQTLPEGYQLRRFSSLGQRWQMAKLMFENAKVRLLIPEAHRVHKEVIEWGVQFSETKIPDQALGASPLMLKLMPWLMAKWQRLNFANRYLMGTLAPRIELDLIPGLLCAAHIAIIAPKKTETLDDQLAAGAAMQRFWLTATSHGLSLQPEMTPLIFDGYLQQGIEFTGQQQALTQANKASKLFRQALTGDADNTVFMARIGYSKTAQARSTRPPLAELLVQSD